MELNPLNINWLIILICIQATFASESLVSQPSDLRRYQKHNDLLTKVSLTQKGYIQFLRYIENIPTITEYTFCIWMKSLNLTHAHPLLSYSKHEQERLIRVWISPHGKSINLEIHGVSVFKIPTDFHEHKWYHICQSWSSEDASWELFVNNKPKIKGFDLSLAGVHIKSGGDLVVGQEYTDFDKGLEDGIEGDIFGFNFVLSSTTSKRRKPKYSFYKPNPLGHHSFLPHNRLPHYGSFSDEKRYSTSPAEVPRFRRQPYSRISPKNNYKIKLAGNEITIIPNFETVKSVSTWTPMSIGMKLVELSKDCRLGKGAPLHGDKVLISWTRNTVRVFGGAIVKPIKPFC